LLAFKSIFVTSRHVNVPISEIAAFRERFVFLRNLYHSRVEITICLVTYAFCACYVSKHLPWCIELHSRNQDEIQKFRSIVVDYTLHVHCISFLLCLLAALWICIPEYNCLAALLCLVVPQLALAV
jgi:CDGSH-type Zn-finger protein